MYTHVVVQIEIMYSVGDADSCEMLGKISIKLHAGNHEIEPVVLVGLLILF